MSWSFFFSAWSRSDLFSICRYQVPIRYLALTNIFLDNTAGSRKKYRHPSCSLIFFFYFAETKYTLIWLFLILHMLLQHWPSICFALPGECVMLHCDSRPSCTASWHVYTTQPMLGTSISSIAFFIFLTLTCKISWTRCLFISHTFSIYSIACFTCSAVWDPCNYCAYQHVVTWKWNKYNAEMVRHTGD